MNLKYQVLAEDGVYEYEASDLASALDFFEADHPGKDCEVFAEGNCPDLLTLEEFREIYAIFGNLTAVMLFNRMAKRILESYMLEQMTDSLTMLAFKAAIIEPRDDYGTTGFDYLSRAVHFSEDHPHHEPQAFDVVDDLRKVIDMIDPYFVSEDD